MLNFYNDHTVCLQPCLGHCWPSIARQKGFFFIHVIAKLHSNWPSALRNTVLNDKYLSHSLSSYFFCKQLRRPPLNVEIKILALADCKDHTLEIASSGRADLVRATVEQGLSLCVAGVWYYSEWALNCSLNNSDSSLNWHHFASVMLRLDTRRIHFYLEIFVFMNFSKMSY